jgi:hypothetical protein
MLDLGGGTEVGRAERRLGGDEQQRGVSGSPMSAPVSTTSSVTR